MWQRLVHSLAGWYSGLSAFAAFSGALLRNRTARALLHTPPTEKGLLAESLPQSYDAVCAYHLNLAGIRVRRAELFCWIKALLAHSCHLGYEM